MSCLISEKALSLDTAIRMLENVDDYIYIRHPPTKPKGGEVFLFLPELTDEQENYKCDQYRWLNSGPKEIPRKNPLVKKQYFIGKLPGGKTPAFQKHCYVLVSDQRAPYPVLLHYIGDETVMIDYPHGNAKQLKSSYFAIAPSVRKDIALRSQRCMPSAIINSYKVPTVSGDGDEEKGSNPVLTPRNKTQVRNIRRKEKLSINRKGAASTDDLNALYSLGSELGGFVRYIRTQPDLICIVGLSDLVDELGNIMGVMVGNTVVFSFHETFKIGSYFLTPFSFLHSAFSSLPSIPFFFLISDSSDFFIFEKFILTIVECVPLLETYHTAVITNQDYCFTASLGLSFPNWLQFYDWEILFTTTRSFLRKLNMDTKDITARIKQLKMLMTCESYELYRKELERYKKEWPLALHEYYVSLLQEPIEMGLGRWVLEKYKLYSPDVGVSKGTSPDLQLVVRHLHEVKNLTLDVILPTIYHFQNYLHSNIQKGYCGCGKYALESSYRFLMKDPKTVIIPTCVYEPEDLVKIFRVRGTTTLSDMLDTSDDEDITLLQAHKILQLENVSHVPSLQSFLVKSVSGSVHGVRLFPRESCSCSLNQRCAHIMAVRLFLEMPLCSKKKVASKPSKHELSTTVETKYFVHASGNCIEVSSGTCDVSQQLTSDHCYVNTQPKFQIGNDNQNVSNDSRVNQTLEEISYIPQPSDGVT